MFSHKRKLSLIVGFLLFNVSLLFSQKVNDNRQKTLIGVKQLVLGGVLTQLPIYKVTYNTVTSNNVKEHSKILLDHNTIKTVYAKDWNNNTLNPYGASKVMDPFILHFEDHNFSPPTDHKMVVTSRYGGRRGKAHAGIDIDLITGDNVKVLLGGKVRFVGNSSGYGKTIVVRHDSGIETVYAHLSEYLVKENSIVEKGQVIGKGGTSGNARGSHLHLEVRYQGKSIHPEYLFDFTTETKVRSNKLVVTKKWMTPRFHKSTEKSTIVVQTSVKEIPKEERLVSSTYVVKKGDTLTGIARKHDTNISEICKKNAIESDSVLNIGQEIVIY